MDSAPATICFACYRERACDGPFCSACWDLIAQRRRELAARGRTESVDAAVDAIERHWQPSSAIPCSKGSGPEPPPQRG